MKQPKSVSKRREYVSILTKLTSILNKSISQYTGQPRVNGAPTTSNNQTHPATLQTTKCIHQRHTHANKPYATFLDEHKKKKEEQNKKTTTATKISTRTLNKILQEQATENTKKQVVHQQQNIHIRKRENTRSPTKKGTAIPIAQDEDNEDYQGRAETLPEEKPQP